MTMKPPTTSPTTPPAVDLADWLTDLSEHFMWTQYQEGEKRITGLTAAADELRSLRAKLADAEGELIIVKASRAVQREAFLKAQTLLAAAEAALAERDAAITALAERNAESLRVMKQDRALYGASNANLNMKLAERDADSRRLDKLAATAFEHRDAETGDCLGWEWCVSTDLDNEDIRAAIDAMPDAVPRRGVVRYVPPFGTRQPPATAAIAREAQKAP